MVMDGWNSVAWESDTEGVKTEMQAESKTI
jgi:hypothetical protein